MNLLALSIGFSKTDYMLAKIGTEDVIIKKVGAERSCMDLVNKENVNEIEKVIDDIFYQTGDPECQVYMTLPTELFRMNCWINEDNSRKMKSEEIKKFIEGRINRECANRSDFVFNQTNKLIRRQDEGIFISSAAVEKHYINTIEKVIEKSTIDVYSIEPEALSISRIICNIRKTFILIEKASTCLNITVCDEQRGLFTVPLPFRYCKAIEDCIFFIEEIVEETFKVKSSPSIPIFTYNFHKSEQAAWENIIKDRVKKIRIPQFIKIDKKLEKSDTVELQGKIHLLGTLNKGLLDDGGSFLNERGSRSNRHEFSLKTFMQQELLSLSKKEVKINFDSMFSYFRRRSRR